VALSIAYADAATYRAVVSKSDAGDDGAVSDDLKAVSRFVDHATDRFFGRDDAPVARVYAVPIDAATPLRDPFWTTPWSGTGVASLAVDDIATATGLEVRADAGNTGTFGDPAWAATDYALWPVNAALGPEPRPYMRILVPAWSSQGGFAGGTRVQVTAVWGWPEVPHAIVRATCHLTGILRLESPRATSRVNEMGEVLSTNREAQNIVRDLVKIYRRNVVVFA
jgi:hypothetical protein